jgi:hypothetical protein
LLAGVFWIALLDFPNVGDHGPIDDSWQEAYGYFLKHRLQAGTDYVLSFGPLGYFYTTAYDPDLFWLKYGWELALKLLGALLLTITVRRQPGWFLAATLWMLVLLFWAPAHREATDAFYPFLIVGGGALVLAEDCPSLLRLAAFALLLAVVAQVKFSLCVLCFAEVILVVAYLIVTARWRAAACVGTLFALFVLTTWIAAGQSPLNLPGYARASLEMAAGYAAAMGLVGDVWELVWAIVLLSVFAALLWTFDLRQTSPKRVAALVLLFAVSFVLQWKHGFTRQVSHSFKFFAYSLIIPFVPALALRPLPARRVARAVLSGAGVCLALVSIYRANADDAGPIKLAFRAWTNWRANAATTFAPHQRKSGLDQARAELRQTFVLPSVQRVVAGSSVDVFTYEQVVLFANGLNWKPRPVFQSYSAYTPYLLSANAAFLRSDSAPDYLLVRWLAIDDRVPAAEDGAALLEILRYYRSVLEERGYALLRRRLGSGPERREPRQVCQRVIQLGEDVEVDNFSRNALTLTLRIHYTGLGTLRELVYSPAPLFLTVRTHDDHSATFRLIPSLAENGFLISPFVGRSEDLLRLYDGTCPRALSFRVHTQEGGENNYEPQMLMTLTEHPDLINAP